MKRITKILPETPFDAVFIKPLAKHGRALTVEYYNAAGLKLVHVPFGQSVIREDVYMKMTTPIAEPKGKAPGKDPIRKDQDKKRDLPYGRNVPKGEEEVLKMHKDKPEVLEPDDKAPKNPVKSRAKLTVGTVRGSQDHSLKRGKGMYESMGDETTFTWGAIHAALIRAGLEDSVQAVMLELNGNELSMGDTLGEGKTTFSALRKRLREAPEDAQAADNFVYDPTAAQDEFQQGMEGGGEKKKALIRAGMSDTDVTSKLVNLAKPFADDIQNMPRSSKIRVVRFVNNVVDEILPATLVSIQKMKSGEHAAKVKILGKEKILPLGDRYIKLKQDDSNQNFYYLDYGDSKKEPLRVARY